MMGLYETGIFCDLYLFNIIVLIYFLSHIFKT